MREYLSSQPHKLQYCAIDELVAKLELEFLVKGPRDLRLGS